MIHCPRSLQMCRSHPRRREKLEDSVGSHQKKASPTLISEQLFSFEFWNLYMRLSVMVLWSRRGKPLAPPLALHYSALTSIFGETSTTKILRSSRVKRSSTSMLTSSHTPSVSSEPLSTLSAFGLPNCSVTALTVLCPDCCRERPCRWRLHLDAN